jgi:hypothetical protein
MWPFPGERADLSQSSRKSINGRLERRREKVAIAALDPVKQIHMSVNADCNPIPIPFCKKEPAIQQKRLA